MIEESINLLDLPTSHNFALLKILRKDAGGDVSSRTVVRAIGANALALKCCLGPRTRTTCRRGSKLRDRRGFWAAAFCMLPSLLALHGLSQSTVWRASSSIIALVMITYGATYRTRRRSMVGETLPIRRWVPIAAVSTLVIAGLLGNVAGIPYEPGVAPIALAATWTFACGAGIFLVALDVFWQRPDPS